MKKTLKRICHSTCVGPGRFALLLILLFGVMTASAENLAGKESNLADQSTQVTGTVVDESDNPIPGVTVVVKGTTIGTVTNEVGVYTLTNVPTDATLSFSVVGITLHQY